MRYPKRVVDVKITTKGGRLIVERKRAMEAWGKYVVGLIYDRPMADKVVPTRA